MRGIYPNSQIVREDRAAENRALIWRFGSEQGIDGSIGAGRVTVVCCGSVFVANAYRSYRAIQRRRCRQIMVGTVPVGGDAPISVQTMTNSLTSDVPATMAQINLAAKAGADIVRVSCPDKDSTTALRQICAESPVPIVADIHFLSSGDRAAESGVACCGSTPAISAMRCGCVRWYRRARS